MGEKKTMFTNPTNRKTKKNWLRRGKRAWSRALINPPRLWLFQVALFSSGWTKLRDYLLLTLFLLLLFLLIRFLSFFLFFSVFVFFFFSLFVSLFLSFFLCFFLLFVYLFFCFFPFGQRPRRGRWPMLSHIGEIFPSSPSTPYEAHILALGPKS